jgi:hypothetical protein
VDDILEEVSSDALRFYLAIISPELQVENFEKQKFMDWLHQKFNPFISSLEGYMDRHGGAWALADFIGLPTERAENYRREWSMYTESAGFSIGKLAQLQERFMEAIEAGIADDGSDELNLLLQVYLVMGKPIHPELSDSLIERFGIDEKAIVDWLLQPVQDKSLA